MISVPVLRLSAMRSQSSYIFGDSEQWPPSWRWLLCPSNVLFSAASLTSKFPHNVALLMKKVLVRRYWDTRQQTPAHTQQLPERVYAMSVRHPLMVVATADRNILVYNLANPQVLPLNSCTLMKPSVWRKQRSQAPWTNQCIKVSLWAEGLSLHFGNASQ